MDISVCGDIVSESTSEKLLGLIVNNTLTWKNHLYGDNENSGLIKDLSKRIGILKKLRQYIPDQKFKQIVSGIFTSKLIYCMTVWGKVWNLPESDDNSRGSSITKKDLHRLQVLQNRSLRLVSRLPYDTPVVTLLDTCNHLSVHQLIAYSIACQTYKIATTKLPTYHYDRLFIADAEPEDRTKTVDFGLALAKGSFFYQASRIWCRLPLNIRDARTIDAFKTGCRKWVRDNITIRP